MNRNTLASYSYGPYRSPEVAKRGELPGQTLILQMRLPSLSAAHFGANLEEKESLLAVLITSCTAPGKVAAEVGKEISWKQVWELALILIAAASELLQHSWSEISRHILYAHISMHLYVHIPEF